MQNENDETLPNFKKRKHPRKGKKKKNKGQGLKSPCKQICQKRCATQR
jgi:hypothetical protein